MKKNCKLLTILMMAVFAFTGCDQNPEEEVVLKGITLDTTNVKTEFTVGDEFTTDGLVVTAAYSDETTKTVDGWTATGNDLSKPAESQEITITYAEDEVEVSASYTIVVKAKAAGGEPEPEPEPEPLPAKIDLKFNTSYTSNVLVEIFGNYYVSDKTNENYKDYSVCKNTALSDSLIQLKIENYTEDYSVTINDAKTTVTEGKIALSDILKNTIFGKNTIKVLKGEEVIDSAEYTVETGYYDCIVPALKIITKEGSSGEVDESHVIKTGENLRYGVKRNTPSKIELYVVQSDGNEYPSNIKTSFKIEDGETKNVEKNLVTLEEKENNTIKVTVSAEVPEKYNKPGANYVSTASFTTKYDIETGYVRTYDKNNDRWDPNYVLEYSPDGKNFTTIAEEIMDSPIYCFDEYGDIYYTGNSSIGHSINKYSVNTKTSTKLWQVNFCLTLSYDYENSTLYCLNENQSENEMLIICGETNKNYSISAYEGKNISDIKRIAVKDGNLYVLYEDTNTLYKYTMNISDTEIKLENEESYHFPANIKTVENGNVTVNDMLFIDDDIYLAVAFGEDYDNKFEVYEKTINYVTESRGCILKFNTLKNEFDVTGLYEDKHECYSGDYTAYWDRSGILSMEGNSKPILYYDKTLQNPVKIKIKMISYEPELNDSKYLGYVLKFAAIKPKKLICNQNRNFIYADDDGSINIKKINAYSSVDLYDFAIKDSYEKINEEIIDTSFDNCAPIKVFEQPTTLYYLNECGLTDHFEFTYFSIK